MTPLSFWGLPSSKLDPLLFGDEEPWAPERYDAGAALQQRQERAGGADTDLDPIVERDRIVDLTETDADRAAILRRYRLFTRQPDEMITLMALQRMNPRELDFDPQLYQYGGGYIYMIGAALGLSHVLGVTDITSDVGLYLSQPELFARFYIVARMITLIFGALALVAVLKLARYAAGRTAGWIAFAFVACSPVFITGVLEAKPHLPSTCLLLWATLSAWRFHSRRRRRDALHMGWQTGGAFGLVLTGLAGAALWPALMLSQVKLKIKNWRRLLGAGLLALGFYAITNPYIPYNLLFNRNTLTGNVDNSMSMYTIGRLGDGFARTLQLLLESCGPGALILGVLSLIWLGVRHPRQTLIATSPAAAMMALCIAIGADKPAEFARFLLLPAVTLAVAAAVLATHLARVRLGWGIAAAVLALGLMRTSTYLHSFHVDAHLDDESRYQAALYIRDQAPLSETIGVVQIPAPYATPPLNYARRRVAVLPPDEPKTAAADNLPAWLMLTADDATSFKHAWWRGKYRLVKEFAADPFRQSRIAWANKPVYIFRRRASE